MSVIIQSSFALSNLSCVVDDGNNDRLVVGVLLKKERSYLEVLIGDTQVHQLGIYPEKESLCLNIT